MGARQRPSPTTFTAAEVASRLNVVLFDFSEGRVLGRWDPFEERFVQAEGQ